MGYRWVEHTGDVELEIEAPTEEAVFSEALLALAELLGDGPREDRISSEIAVAGEERALLLVRWLEEFVYRAETENLVPRRSSASSWPSAACTRWCASASGPRGTSSRV